jgi:hypothetical protein
MCRRRYVRVMNSCGREEISTRVWVRVRVRVMKEHIVRLLL